MRDQKLQEFADRIAPTKTTQQTPAITAAGGAGAAGAAAAGAAAGVATVMVSGRPLIVSGRPLMVSGRPLMVSGRHFWRSDYTTYHAVSHFSSLKMYAINDHDFPIQNHGLTFKMMIL